MRPVATMLRFREPLGRAGKVVSITSPGCGSGYFAFPPAEPPLPALLLEPPAGEEEGCLRPSPFLRLRGGRERDAEASVDGAFSRGPGALRPLLPVLGGLSRSFVRS